MTKKQFKDFVMKHKREIITGGVVLGGIGGMALLIALGGKGVINLDKSNWSLGSITELWKQKDHIDAIGNNITVSDIGKLGEELLKIEGVKPDTKLEYVLSLLDIDVINF